MKDLTLKNGIMFLLALILMGAGISIYINTGVGVGAWDALHGNLTTLGITIGDYELSFGNWVFIVGAITVTVSQIFYKNLGAFLAIITGLLLGVVIDLWMIVWSNTGFIINIESYLIRWIFFFIAIILLGSGIALLVLSKLPPTPIDILMLSYMHRFNLNFNIAKFLTESTAFVAAVIVGLLNTDPDFRLSENIGIGTLIAIFTIGIVVQYSTKIWKKLFKLTY